MTINLVEKFSPVVDEKFTAEAKSSLLTNNDYDWTGAKTVKVYTVTTADMNDYDRAGAKEQASRYGKIQGLDATTDDYTITKDRAFTFAIDKLDKDETGGVLAGASALERQQREVIIPEYDSYVFGVMVNGAGTKANIELSKDNIYNEILKANEILDDNLVPDTERVLVLTSQTHNMLKQSGYLRDNNISQEMMVKGVVGMIDGVAVMKVAKSRLPQKFGFMLTHPVATVAPRKLEEYKIHEDPPYISGSLVEGRVVYDAFVLNNKKMAIYYMAMTE